MSIIWAHKVSAEFIRRLLKICSSLRIDPDFLMACIAFETGETFSASVRNKRSGATGLIQFMPQTAAALGTSVEELALMTEEDQLDYVSKYFLPWKGKLLTLEDTYMAILYPLAIGKANGYILFAKNDTKHPKRYVQNAGLDYNKDGYITKAEAAAKVRAKYDKGKSLKLTTA